MGELDAIQRRLEDIDRELTLLRRGQLVLRKRSGIPWVFRIWKEGERVCSQAVGAVDGPEHVAALEQIQRRRDLSRERRSLGRECD